MSARESHPVAVQLYRFGPYELDVERNELRKFGLRLKVERKPLQLLFTLVDRAGEVVTRNELRQLLWGEDVFVDFDRGLNVAVNKLRIVLNDPSETRKYIETIAGKGYRFIADLERVLATDSVPVPAPANAEPEQSFSASVIIQNPCAHPEHVLEPPVPGSVRQLWWTHRLVQLAAVLVMVLLAVIFGVKNNWIRKAGPQQSRTGKIMLVVLPFENLSGDSSLEYLSDGLTEELSEQLGNLSPDRLGVIGRTSAMTYKHSSHTISQIGKELGVAYVLEGSVRRSGKKLRITAQLVEVSDQAHVWAADYDREIGDVLQLEDDIALETRRQVGISVALKTPRELTRHHPGPEAHEAYLLGRYYWNKRTSAGRDMASQYFRRAIQLDPQYAAAYAGLAECGPDDMVKAAALKAVELDPNSAEARTALGFVELFLDVNVPTAQRTLKTAIELNPNYATAHHWYAVVMEATGDLPQAVAELREAAKLDPLSLIIRAALAHELSMLGQQDAALAELKPVFDMDPRFPKAHETLGIIYERQGMYEAAVHEFQLSAQYGGGDPLWPDLGYIYAVSGHKQEALSMLARLETMEKRFEASPCDLALVDVGLGRKEEAIAWLQKASLKPDQAWLFLRADPRFDPLRPDPRFQNVLRRMRLSS